MNVRPLLCLAAGLTLSGRAAAGPSIAQLLDQDKPFVMLAEADFRALHLALPDGGKHVTDLALAAPGGAFAVADLCWRLSWPQTPRT